MKIIYVNVLALISRGCFVPRNDGREVLKNLRNSSPHKRIV